MEVFECLFQANVSHLAPADLGQLEYADGEYETV